MVGIVSKGHVLGMEDNQMWFQKSPTFSYSAFIVSQKVDLFVMDRELFNNVLKQTQTWNDLMKKHMDYMLTCRQSVKVMKKSNITILENLKRKISTTNPNSKGVAEKLILLLDNIKKNDKE